MGIKQQGRVRVRLVGGADWRTGSGSLSIVLVGMCVRRKMHISRVAMAERDNLNI